MSNRKSLFFYALLFIIAGTMVGLVIASRMDMASLSSAQTLAVPPMNSTPITGPLTATTFRDIAKAVSPAVVNIRTESRRRTQDLSDFFGPGDLFDFFGPGGGTVPPRGQGPQGRGQGQGPPPRERLVESAGTGFIIDKSGLILTNNHVVEGASKIAVSLYGQDEDQEYDARVIGRDELTDSALIELTEKPNHELPVARFGDSSQMQPGDWVMAIGNPFGLAHTVSVGVISGNRPNELTVAAGRRAEVLQTDAAINPGNSGGPLLNLRGEVIGINTAILSDGRQGNMGVGFAIPSNTVRELLPQLRVGKIVRGRIGVSVEPITRNAIGALGLKNNDGALVRSVTPDGPSDDAGIEPGDVIVNYGGKPVRRTDDLVQMILATKPGTVVPVRVVREGQERTLSVTVEELDLETEDPLRADAGRGGGDRNNEPQQQTSSGFGITMNNITPDVARRAGVDSGALIVEVEPGSPAARRGLQAGDIILRVGRQAVDSAADAQRELSRVPSGSTVGLRVLSRSSQNTWQEAFVTITKE